VLYVGWTVITDRRTALFGLIGLAGVGGVVRLARPAPATIADAQPPVRRIITSAGLSSVTLTQIPLGGGGFVTGLDISADGQRLTCRTDVANAYVRNFNESAWQPLFSPRTMEARDFDPLPALNNKADGQGVAGICIAPSNKDIIIASYCGYIWRSVDGGKSVRRTRLQQVAMLSNAGQQRLFNQTIDIHPDDPQKVLVGTWGEGVWYTLDGGDIWKRLALPDSEKSYDGNPGIHLVLFDPSKSERVYVFVTGIGLYGATDVAGDFERLEGGPKFCSSLKAARDGTVLLCEHSGASDGMVWHYGVSGWGSNRPQHEASVIAVDPQHPNKLVASNPDGFCMVSSDGGRSFDSLGGVSWEKTGGEVDWIGSLTTVFPAELKIDPIQPDRLWIAHGAGVAKARMSMGKYTLTDWSSGIEELCSVAAISVPGGKTYLSSWDFPFWRVDSLKSYANGFRYPVPAGKEHNSSFVGYGSYIDYASDDPHFLVGIVAPSDGSAPGYTKDGGDNWSAFESTPQQGWGNGGCIAASTTKNIVLLPSNNGFGTFTQDGGKTWEPIMLDGENPTSGFANSFYVKRKNLAADKERNGTFALVYTVVRNEELDEPLGGVWLTRDGGRTWSQMLKGVIDNGDHLPTSVRRTGQDDRQYWNCQLEYVPQSPGELVYTPHADFHNDRLWWSRDDGRNWVELHPQIRNVTSFGFGKNADGQTRPAVYFWGDVGEIKGLYVSLNWFATVPSLITRFPSQMLAEVAFVGGDPNHLGRVYIGTSCAGWIQADVKFKG
jgi:hypothetical protein